MEGMLEIEREGGWKGRRVRDRKERALKGG